MGSPLGPTLANAILVHHKKNGFNVVHWNIDHYTIKGTLMTFVLLNSPEHLKHFHSYLNSCHLNISFTTENEKDNRMSFLDINIICVQGRFNTFVYHKPTFSRIDTYFDSFLPFSNKIGL